MQEKIFQKLKTMYSSLGLSSDVLQSQAQALSAMGVVNDDNLETVVASQKGFLEGLQKEYDRRASQAKASVENTLKAEYDKKLAEEIAKQNANVPPAPQVEPVPAPTPAPAPSNEQPSWFTEFINAQKTAMEAQNARFDKLSSENAELSKALHALEEENANAKASQLAQQRTNLILNKAKELGIPQYRIDEGFNIPETADEAQITSYLTNVTNNIKAQTLPTHGASFTLANANADKAETDAIAKSLIL